jgi:hypothetical protein
VTTVFSCLLTSASLSGADFALIVKACDSQLADDFAIAWERRPAVVVLGLVKPESGIEVIPVLLRDTQPDDPDGALAYHWVDPATGKPAVHVLVDRIMSEAGATRDDVCCALGHELIETEGDEYANEWSDRGDGTEEPHELADRVQGGRYIKRVKNSNGSEESIACTNFLLPLAFDDVPVGGAKYDWCGQLTSPREIGPGGYTITRPTDGGETTVFGDRVAARRYSCKTLERHGVKG